MQDLEDCPSPDLLHTPPTFSCVLVPQKLDQPWLLQIETSFLTRELYLLPDTSCKQNTDIGPGPYSIKPTHYDLSLFNLEFGGEWSFDGLVKIHSKVKSDTEELVINVKELQISSVEVYGNDGSGKQVWSSWLAISTGLTTPISRSHLFDRCLL